MDLSSVIRQLALSVLPVLIAITFHEVAHGLVASRLGDPTARMMGRLTLNPLAHIDLFGTILMPLLLLVLTNGQFVFGYAKPVPINPMNFKNPRKGMALSAAGGPAMNILLAVLSAVALKGFEVIPFADALSHAVSLKVMDPVKMMLVNGVVINIVLAVFNCIPIPPLDGGRVLVGLLPYRQAMSFSRIEPFGFIIVLVLIATRLANYFVIPLVLFCLYVLQTVIGIRLL